MKTLNEILDAYTNTEYATDAGLRMHTKLQSIVIDGNSCTGDAGLVDQISAHSDLLPFFAPNTRPEVPIAGYINGRFISRRIDRLCIDDMNRKISVLDYKTDTTHDRFYDKYIEQIREYVQLLRMIYPDYSIEAYILWTHDFSLEKLTNISL